MLIAPTMAHGTATEALEASSLMCTLESNEPAEYVLAWNRRERVRDHTNGPKRSDEAHDERVAARPSIHCKSQVSLPLLVQ